MNNNQTIHFNNICVSLLELRVYFKEAEIHFTLSELRLLLIFLTEPYRTISPEELVRRADLTSLSSLHVLVARLRTLLNQEYIYTATGSAGYCFVMSAQRQALEERVHGLDSRA